MFRQSYLRVNKIIDTLHVVSSVANVLAIWLLIYGEKNSHVIMLIFLLSFYIIHIIGIIAARFPVHDHMIVAQISIDFVQSTNMWTIMKKMLWLDA